MKVRKLDEAGDMTMGRGSSCFLADTPDAVAQNVMTRLALWRGRGFWIRRRGRLGFKRFLESTKRLNPY